MLFNSYIFVLLFFPLTLIGYFVLNHIKKYQMANLFLIGMSLWFYGYYNPIYLLVICGSVLFNYGLTWLMNGVFVDRDGWRKGILAFGIFVNAASIFYFKYYNFFIENVNTLFGASFTIRNIVLPLGISFFTFQQISYLVDSAKGDTEDYSFIEYALFVVYFPQLIAGPIVLHKEMIPQFRDVKKRKIDYRNLSKGLYVFSLGLFKKILIADTFGKAVSYGFGITGGLSSLEAFLVSLAYTFQLYFDFSGYCDMAIGIGNMFNIELPQNFNSPYQALSIVDFWSRWHMSLTRFLREYIYFPLGGSRKGKIRTYINIMIVFLVSGIWHGANWTFIIWGAIHGVLNCLNRIFKNFWNNMHVVIRWAATFMTVNLLWVLFRADSLGQALLFLKRMVCMDSFQIAPGLLQCFQLPELVFIESKWNILAYFSTRITGLNMWAFFLIAFVIVLNAKNSKEVDFEPTVRKGLSTVVLLVWSIVSMAGVSEFLYFGF